MADSGRRVNEDFAMAINAHLLAALRLFESGRTQRGIDVIKHLHSTLPTPPLDYIISARQKAGL